MSDIQAFEALIRTVTAAIGNRTLDTSLQADLNDQFPYEGEVAQAIQQACTQGMAQGWMGQHEHRGLRYGRVIEPCAPLNGFSVDVVDMNDIAGPHHRHPGGEIDFIMPVDPQAQFDGQGAGWLVYGPQSAHSPTVSQGRALVLYLLPGGQIEFTRR